MDFLLEIGVEELPSSYIEPALEELRLKLEAGLREERVPCSSLEGYCTPRRLAVLVKDVAERQEDLEKEVMGPAARVAFDEKGRPTGAGKGFARGQGVPVDSLVKRKTEKGEYVCALVKERGKPVSEVLSRILPGLILSLSFPRTMTWNDPATRFGRPIRWLVALLGDAVVAFEAAGVGSGRNTFGNRFLAPSAIQLQDPLEYVEKLRRAWVLADRNERGQLVQSLIQKEAGKKGGRVLEDPELVGIVTNLLEYPVAVLGSFEESFLALPRDVLVTAMREHQRYFAVEDRDGNLLPFFVTLRNGGKEGEDDVRRGNEGVLKARLDDARFYWEKDLSIGIHKQLELLKQVVWHESLGSVFDKSGRLSELSAFVVQSWDDSRAEKARRAGLLCKTDLVSEMVKDGKEFTTLQGIIGAEYAAKAGEDVDVTLAMKEHYLPRFPGDDLPSSLEGCAVSIADRLDEIAGCFAAQRIPSGSEDPYGLRRHANGVMRILIEKSLHLRLSRVTEKTLQLLSHKWKQRESLGKEMGSFLEQRLAFVLSDGGIEQDVVDSVLSADSDDPYRAWLKARSLAGWKSNEEFSQVVISFKRVSNILKGERYSHPSSGELSETVEVELLKAVEEASGLVSEAISEGSYDDAVAHLLSLKKPIDDFFDGVMVMDSDQNLRTRRLGLLDLVREEFLKLADFSRLTESAPIKGNDG
ncbi:MAG: glycine--tRNA ligase subunit beta [Candidatus Eiseniibacteriota bacterium]|nr:MAG: glycine--tRNA ligase subunit beta [Candidatus Eisenbacteria bacterium]